MFTRITDFLGLSFPEDLIKDGSVKAELTTQDIQEVIPERVPAFFANKAVIVEFLNDKGDPRQAAFVSMPVTAEMCQGHMPNAPILPLGIGGWMLSQAGEVAVGFISGNAQLPQKDRSVPLVLETGPVKSKNRDFIVPGDTLLAIAKITSHRFGVFRVDTEAWLGNQQVVEVNDMVYASIPLDKFLERRNHHGD